MLPEESLCRICLSDGARVPIFEHADNDDNIYTKLSTCLNETVEDIEGYPRHICLKCMNKLNLVCKFIKKYKDTCKILQYSIISVKDEKIFDIDYKDDINDNFDQTQQEQEEEQDLGLVVRTKVEPPDSDDDQKYLIEFVKCSPKSRTKLKRLTIPSKLKSLQEPKTCRKPRTPRIVKRKATAVATCILEGNFVWNGEKWCSSKEPMNIKFMDPETQQKPKRKRKVDIETQIKKKRIRNKKTSEKLCDLCGEVFKNKDHLLRHRNLVHFPKKLKCPECPKFCNTEYYLNRHIKRSHSNKKEFICAECGKEYAFLSEMNSHIKKVHNKNPDTKRVFACSMCERTFACQKSVTIHERSVHTGERPAVCTVCDSSFAHEDYLKEHMRLHTGETPFKCPVCGRGYAQRCNMKSHIKQHRISELDSDLMSKIRPNYLRLMKP